MRTFWALLVASSHAAVTVEMGLCSAQGTQKNRKGWARDSWSNANNGTPNPHLTIEFQDENRNPISVHELTEFEYSRDITDKYNGYTTESQTLNSVDISEVHWVRVASNVVDILCIETLKLTATGHEYNIIQDYDPHNYDPEKMSETCATDGPNGSDVCRNNWESLTGKHISFWTKKCQEDGRFLTTTSPFQRSCHDDVIFPITLINECETGDHDCVEHATCTDTATKYECTCNDSHPYGYAYTADGEKAAPCHQDPCQDDTDLCGPEDGGECIDLDDDHEHGFMCTCDNNNCYKQNADKTECVPMDNPCDEDDICGTGGICVPGSCGMNGMKHTCECDEGFKKKGKKCVDVPECDDDDTCAENQECVELVGSYECKCMDGYYETSHGCEVVDPCEDGTHDCVSHATCHSDGPNEYHCECNDSNKVGDGTRSGTGCKNVELEGICVEPDANGEFDYSWVKKWKVYQGCRAPTCDARLTVVDAWKRKTTRGKGGKMHYGWSVLVHLDEKEFDGEHGDGWTVLARLPKDIEKGSFQVWNARFFNFYEAEDGYYFVLENKYGGWGPKNDRHDRWSFNLIGERTTTEAIPNLLFWNVRYRLHQCFDPSHHSRGTTSIQQYLIDNNKDPDSEVQKLVMSRGKLIRAF